MVALICIVLMTWKIFNIWSRKSDPWNTLLKLFNTTLTCTYYVHPLTQQISCCDEYARNKENWRCESIVGSKNEIVDDCFVCHKSYFQGGCYRWHQAYQRHGGNVVCFCVELDLWKTEILVAGICGWAKSNCSEWSAKTVRDNIYKFVVWVLCVCTRKYLTLSVWRGDLGIK